MSDKRKKLTSRETLRNYFSPGSLPRAEHFHELIDSTLNMEDEGFNKTPEDGLQVSTRGGGSGLLSFFREGRDLRQPPWRLQFDASEGALEFVQLDDEADPEAGEDGGDPGADEPRAVLSLAPGGATGGKVGINHARPEFDLDVDGIVRTRGRSGVVPDRKPDGEKVTDPSLPTPPVLANGKWHNITGDLTGCTAFEVVAGVGGRRGNGEYALLFARAMNAYNPRGRFLNPFGFNFLRRKNRIRVQHAYFRSRRDKLHLRWSGEETRYCLQIKSRRDYGTDDKGRPIRILYHLTELWHHPTMRDGSEDELFAFGPEAEGTALEAGPDEPPPPVKPRSRGRGIFGLRLPRLRGGRLRKPRTPRLPRMRRPRLGRWWRLGK